MKKNAITSMFFSFYLKQKRNILIVILFLYLKHKIELRIKNMIFKIKKNISLDSNIMIWSIIYRFKENKIQDLKNGFKLIILID